MRYGLGYWPRCHPLALILLIALVHGLLHIVVVPPWQHYDEPTHFEYAWLIANRPSLPRVGDYDQDMRRQVAASMMENGFFRDLRWSPDFSVQDEPVNIGFSELVHPPAYYLLVSLPLRFLRFTDMAIQLYAARFVSLLLYLVSIMAAWGVMVELVPPKDSLCWMVPATIALLPGFTDLMTAVNNDVGAVALFSLFLWGCVYLVRRGFSIGGLLWGAGATLLGLVTKVTIYIAVPLLILALSFSLFRGRRRWVVWTFLAVGGLASFIAIFSWGEPAFWYRSTYQPAPTRASTPGAPFGAFSFQLQITPDDPLVPAIRQFLPLDEVRGLRGKTVTLGAWMWATQPFTASPPLLSVAGTGQLAHEDIVLGTAPNFYAFSARVPDNATNMWVSLEQMGAATSPDTTVFYNGLVLAEGQYPIDRTPVFGDSQGAQGVWGAEAFRNLLRNASAEAAWLQVRPWADRLGGKLIYNYPSWLLASLIDGEGAGWYYYTTLQRLFRSFWAVFGWGGVFLLGTRPYFILALFTLASGIGVVPALWRRRRALPWDVFFLFTIALVCVWGPTLLRGLGESLPGTVYIPVARYAYPVIIPTVLIFVVGWLEILRQIEKRLRVPWSALASLYILLFIALDIHAILSLVSHYQWR